MTQITNTVERLEFSFCLWTTQISEENLYSFRKTAGADSAPDFAETTDADAFNQLIAGNFPEFRVHLVRRIGIPDDCRGTDFCVAHTKTSFTEPLTGLLQMSHSGDE